MPTTLDYIMLALSMVVAAPFSCVYYPLVGYERVSYSDINVLKAEPIQQIEKISQAIPQYYGRTSKYNVTSSIKYSPENGEYWVYTLDEQHPVGKEYTRLQFIISPISSKGQTYHKISGYEQICTKENSAINDCNSKMYKANRILPINNENKIALLLKEVEKQLGRPNITKN